jgi:hypothetical protein
MKESVDIYRACIDRYQRTVTLNTYHTSPYSPLRSIKCLKPLQRITAYPTQAQVIPYHRTTPPSPFSPASGTLVGEPQSGQNVSHFIDGSGPIFSMYLERAKEVDEKMAESWKADADGILIFVRLYFRFPYFTPTYRPQTGLFSAATATLISVSIQDIRQNPQDTSNFYLANIYQATIADLNRPNISTPSSPPPFTPPNYSVWVNGLWFLSLMISITCALLATLLQQWARRYLKVTQPRYSLHKQARIRSFFAEGVEKSFLPLVVEALPTLLHVSLFLFFAGLVVFLWNVNLTIYKIAISWVCVCAAFYGCVTLAPILRRDSPYYTPLTPLARLLYVVILRVFLLLHACFVALIRICCVAFWNWPYCHRIWRNIDAFLGPGDWVIRVLHSTAEEVALKSPLEIDVRAFMWTFDSLDEDQELERFFSSLSDFRHSNVICDPLPSLTGSEKARIVDSLISFAAYTVRSDLLPEVVKLQRAVMCAKVLETAGFDHDGLDRLRDVISSSRPRIITLGPIANGSWTGQTIFTQAIVTEFIARPREYDDSWFRHVAPNALGIPETVLRDYAANGNSLSLAILIHVTRQQFTHCRDWSWPTHRFRDVLEAEFNVQDTLPELQHEFCTLWNQIVLGAQKDNSREIALFTLKPVRGVYAILHRGHDNNFAKGRLRAYPYFTDQCDSRLEDPFFYPACEVADHVCGGSPSGSTSIVRTVPDNNTVLVPPSLASPHVHSLSISAPLHILKSSTDVPLLDNFYPSQTTEGLRLPIASASVMRDIDNSVITMRHPTPETSTFAPLSSSPPVDPVTLPHNAGLLTSSDSPNLPYSASFNPALDNMLRTGSSPYLHSLNYLI